MATKNHILIRLSESDKAQFGKLDFAQQSTPQKVFSSIWALESEVNNGGFSQYFLNNSCETASFVSEALATLGAPKTADICRRAIAAAFPAGLPENPEDISSAAADFPDEVMEALEPLDNEFFEYPHNLTICCLLTSRSTLRNLGNYPKRTTDRKNTLVSMS